MEWKVEYLKEALKDLKSLDHSQQLHVLKAIDKVSKNPLPIFEGGYGKPLGNKSNTNLTGYFKIRLCLRTVLILCNFLRELVKSSLNPHF